MQMHWYKQSIYRSSTLAQSTVVTEHTVYMCSRMLGMRDKPT